MSFELRSPSNKHFNWFSNENNKGGQIRGCTRVNLSSLAEFSIFKRVVLPVKLEIGHESKKFYKFCFNEKKFDSWTNNIPRQGSRGHRYFPKRMRAYFSDNK